MLNLLHRIAQEINSSSDLRETLNLVVHRCRDSVQASVCSIFLWDNHFRRFLLAGNEGFDTSAIGKLSLGANEGIVALVGKREEPINLADATNHPAFHSLAEIGEADLHGLLAVPIMHHRKLLGVIVVQKQEQKAFEESHEAFLVTVSAQLASSIAHAEASGYVRAGFFGQGQTNERFEGIPGATGVAIGQAVFVGPATSLESVPNRKAEDIDQEIKSFHHALAAVREDVVKAGEKVAAELRPEEKALFDVYVSILEDEALGNEVIDTIKEGQWAQGALSQVIIRYARHFSEMDNSYLQERASDIRDLGRRILAYLQQCAPTNREIPEGAIIVGEELTPAFLAEVPENRIGAIVSVMGSANSHIAILARAMGIPTVMGLVDMPYRDLDAQELVVDGYRGHVYCNLTPEKRQHFEQIVKDEMETVQGLETIKSLPCVSKDGTDINLLVNTGLMTDVVRSLDRGAQGVGLYRTEVPFMMRERFPSESEQIEIYRQQLEAFNPHPVIMRTLDVGGDKALTYFPIEEENPFLGWRGIRVTLDHPEIFLVQVRAMLKANMGNNNLKIMLPMVSNVGELEEAQHLIHRVVHELQDSGNDIHTPAIGMMIEVPANIYQIKEYANRVDFLSVGSNDLTQYLLAVDRNNPRVADLYNNFHPAVLLALKKIVEDANEANTPVSICGEIAGDPIGAVVMAAMGYQSLSMNSANLLKVKAVLREVDLSWAKTLLDRVLRLDSPLVIRSTLEFALKKEGIPLAKLGITKPI